MIPRKRRTPVRAGKLRPQDEITEATRRGWVGHERKARDRAESEEERMGISVVMNPDHQIAYEAGVLHRDVSEGNVFFQEVPVKVLTGFLFDWDYAEFASEGLVLFNTEFPERAEENNQYTSIDKSLKDFTDISWSDRDPDSEFTQVGPRSEYRLPQGDYVTRRFCCILSPSKLSAPTASRRMQPITTWNILRHTAHNSYAGPLACSNLFDSPGSHPKGGFTNSNNFPAQDDPLFQLAEDLREQVWQQNPVQLSFLAIPSLPLTHNKVLEIFDKH
ncbi:hypothetical protein K438DRAFT_1930179 [Mycena galopus ATCC 62051]|nr:hypothetical protein K438DRAFT_1930179 [Mycena galopus ATCC 62051]